MTLVRSVPMYLSCVIAQVPLVLPKIPCFTAEANTEVRYHFLRDNVEKGNIVVTTDFTRKTECISYVRQDQFTHT
jgi:hypothetical protein